MSDGDIARLGLSIDSRPVTEAVNALGKLAPAAKTAETSFGGLENASTALEKAASSLERAAADLSAKFPALVKETNAAAAATASLEKSAKTAQTATKGIGDAAVAAAAKVKPLGVDMTALDRALMATVADINVYDTAVKNKTMSTGRAAAGVKQLSFEARNLGFQLVDVTQGVLMGQSAFQIFAQQGGQVAQVIATSPQGLGGLVKELGRSFANLLTPMRLLGAGAVAATVAAYAFNASWKSSAMVLDDTARAAGTTVMQLRALQSVAAGKGIQSDEFVKATERFAQNIYLARNGMGSLGELLRANGERATTFEGTLESVANILQRAGSDQQRLQFLQQAGLPATMEWVRLLSGGADGLRKATQEAGNLSAREQELIDKARQFDEAWARGWASFSRAANRAFIDAKAGLSDLSTWWQKFLGQHIGGTLGKAIRGESDAATGPNGVPRVSITAPANRGPAVDPNAARNGLSLEAQRLSLLGQTASVGQVVRQVEIQIAQARMNGVHITDDEVKALKALAYNQALGITAMRQQIDGYRLEAETVGMTTGQAAAYAAVQERLNEARRNGQVLTAEQIAQLRQEGAALGEAAQRADDARFGFDTFSGAMRDLTQSVRQNGLSWQTLGDVVSNALGRITDRLMDMASRQLWQAAFPSGGGGIGGLFSGLFGGGGVAADPMAVASANGNVFRAPGLSAYSGTIVDQPTMFPINDGPMRFASGAGLMGEAGPEAIMPLRRGADGKLGVQASGGGSGAIQVNVFNAPAGTTATSKQSRDKNGGTRIDITLKRQLDDTGSALIDSGESNMNKSIERRYGLTPRL